MTRLCREALQIVIDFERHLASRSVRLTPA